MVLRLFMIVFLLLGGGALAQTVDAPVMGSSAGGDATAERHHILVAGDALGGGLGAGLMRMASDGDLYDVTIRFNEESGLARPEVYDWSETLPKILEGKDYDTVVLLLGSNDRQQMRDGGLRLAFNSPDWIAAYKTRLDRVLGVAAAAGAKVYLIAIPPMANPDYDAAMQVISALQKERATAKGAAFLDLRTAFVNADGSYTDTGPDETGTIRKLRGRDGITFFKQGNNRLGQLVLEAIVKGAPSLPAVVAAAAPEVPDVAAEVDVPFFGRPDGGGDVVVIQPSGVSAVTSLALGSDAAAVPGSVFSSLQGLARPGSDAARLFATGEPSPAPEGRVDDFTAR